ncbi:MAG: extracellular solute-binding protein [Propionibacteriaceae bacterium]|jgi:arabinogalactan oligomer/maltooligosaccharide transport system substrate-binding protein|nr:extracellular solute-binding protein [Propionibacteriaceae bacterium]
MRKGIALASVAALALTGLAACGGSNDPATDPSTSGSGSELTVWVDQDRMAVVQEAADKFQAETGNTVTLVQKNNDDLQTDFVTQVGQGSGPDITVGAHDWLGNLLQNGVVQPIDMAGAESDYQDVAIAAFSQDGQLYGVPYAVENIALIRNTDLAPTAPKTWDEAVAAGAAAGTAYSILIQTGETGDPYTYYPLQMSFDAPVFETNSDGSYKETLALGGANGEAFANWLASQGPNGTKVLDTSITYDIAVEQFKNGNAPFIVGGPWMIDAFNEAGVKVAVDPIPAPGPKAAVPFVGVQGFYISSKSANPLVAQQFLLDYIGTVDVQVALFNVGNRTPALTAAADQVSSDPVVAGFAAVAEDAVPMPSIPAMTEVWTYWGVTEAGIITGAQAPVEAWQKMVSDIEGAIG